MVPLGELAGPLKTMVCGPVSPGKVLPDWSSPVIVTVKADPAVGVVVDGTTEKEVSTAAEMLNGLLVAD